MNIVFMGTPDFALESLKALVGAGHSIIAVVTNPDKPKGRGMKFVSSPVKEYALEKGFKVFEPEKIKNNNSFLEEIKNLKPEVICVAAYGKILPKELLDIPKWGAINVHGSILPKYRGAAPIQWAVLNGDKQTGITTIYMDEGMDTGDIILTKAVDVGEDETLGELWERLSKVGGDLLVETLEKIKNKTAPRIKQPEGFTLAPMISKDMAKINWESKSAIEIKNLVRGLNPIMGAYSYIKGKKIKFWKVDVLELDKLIKIDQEFKEYVGNIEKVCPGTVLYSNAKKGLYIKANNGIISVIELQGENSKKMNIKDFLRGNSIEAGSIFE